MRIYLGCTVGDLAELWSAQQLVAGRAHAVTSTLRQVAGNADEEELEYAALMAAARSSLERLASSGDFAGACPPPRRVVVAADVPEGMVRPDPASVPSAVVVSEPVQLRDVASVHVDDAEAIGAVRAELAGVPGSHSDVLEDHELLWYARQEIPDVVAGG